MARLMSVSHTTDAVIERRKTVTRRVGWRMLKPGDRLTLCRKVMGRRKGEPLERLAEVEVISVRREPLTAIHSTPSDVAAEGFPDWTPTEFERFFTETFGVKFYEDVTRIEWRYLDAAAPASRGVDDQREQTDG